LQLIVSHPLHLALVSHCGINRGPRQPKAHGLETAPDLAVGEGTLGFWNAIEEVFPSIANLNRGALVLANANVIDVFVLRWSMWPHRMGCLSIFLSVSYGSKVASTYLQ
jgi:hypothetical protein